MLTHAAPQHRGDHRNWGAAHRTGTVAHSLSQNGGMMPVTQPKFDLSEFSPGVLLLHCTGGLSWEDRNVLAECVEKRLSADGRCIGVIVDLAEVEFINSAGLGALFQLAQRLRSQRRRLVLARPQTTFSRLFQISGLSGLAQTAATLDEAAARLQQADDHAEITLDIESNSVASRD